jgi:hypothetical protein
MDLRISRGADIPVASPAKIRREIPPQSRAGSPFPLAGAGRARGRNTAIYPAGACTEKICATASLISRQRSGGVRSVRPLVSHVRSRMHAAARRRRLHLPHSLSLTLIASNIYLLRPLARAVARYGRAPLIIARSLANARFYNLLRRFFPFFFTARAFNPMTSLHVRIALAAHAARIHISSVHKGR